MQIIKSGSLTSGLVVIPVVRNDRLLHLQRDQTAFEELKGFLGADGLGIIDDIKVIPMRAAFGASIGRAGDSEPEIDLENSDFFQIVFRQARRSGDDETVKPHAWLSLGTRRLLRIVVSYVFDQSAVMLVEHPEDGIHFGLARKLIHLLRSGSDHVQTILTSHSTDVLERNAPGGGAVGHDERRRHPRPRTSKVELESAASYIRDEGTLTDFLRIVQED